MAFCQKCGQQIDDQANNCPFCGAATAKKPEPKANVNEVVNKVKNLDTKSLIKLAVGAVAVILVIWLISGLFGGGYKGAVENYIDFTLRGEAKKLEKLAPDEVWEYFDDEVEDFDIDDIIDDYEDTWEEREEMLEDEYGKNVKVKYKITDKEKMDEDDLKDIKENLKETYDISKKDVKAAYELELEVSVKGKDDEDEDDMDLTVVKIGSKWYVYEMLGTLQWLA